MTFSCYKYHCECFIQHWDCNKQLLSVNGIRAIWLTFTFFSSFFFFCSELQHGLGIFFKKTSAMSHAFILSVSLPLTVEKIPWFVLLRNKQRCWIHQLRPLGVYHVFIFLHPLIAKKVRGWAIELKPVRLFSRSKLVGFPTFGPYCQKDNKRF